MPGVGKAPWVSWVEASRYDEGTAYATFDRHMYGDMEPHVYKTTDYGKTWTALPASASGARGYAHVIKEDTVDPNLLFLGTEFGLWISVDGGQRWAQYKGTGFPAVAVRDLVVHPRTSDLVLATHGRGIWIIDDISPLRALTPTLMTEEAAFLPVPPAVQWMETGGGWPEGNNSYSGPSHPDEALIPYYQRTRHIFGDLKFEILDEKGNLVDTVASSKHRGVNRATWSMHLKPPRVPPAASAMFGAAQGPRILPGTYTVKMTKNGKVYTTQLKVVMDPRATYTLDDRKAQFELVNRLSGLLNHMSWAVDAIIGVRDRASAAKLRQQIRYGKSWPRRPPMRFAPRSWPLRKAARSPGEERLREFLAGLYGDVNSYEGRPTDSQELRAPTRWPANWKTSSGSSNRSTAKYGVPIPSEEDSKKAHSE